LRLATRDDVPGISRLIEASVRTLSEGYYTAAQIGSALQYIFGVDTALIDDDTYYVVPVMAGGYAAAGGWSRRRTLYGGDQRKSGDDPLLDPRREPARIRAFFVAPEMARRGLGRLLYERCAAEAHAAGFGALELMATLPGEPFYRALGFAAHERSEATMPDGETLPVVRMSRVIGEREQH
jgi:GNAT superfamily N-acetyltransferase